MSKDVNYEPHPEQSLRISAKHGSIIMHIINLYSGSGHEADINVYERQVNIRWPCELLRHSSQDCRTVMWPAEDIQQPADLEATSSRRLLGFDLLQNAA